MNIKNIKDRENFNKLLFTYPTYFDINYSINPYMSTNTVINDVKKDWLNIIKKLRKYVHIKTVDYRTFESNNTLKQLPDIVFCANHALPTPDGKFILSNMKYKERQNELKYFEKWAKHNNYPIIKIDKNINFEGNGDAKWHPNKNLLWIGHGPRTDKKAVKEIDKLINSKVIDLELNSPLYYHLDICFTPLDEKTVFIIPEAFSTKSYDKINDIFENVLHIPSDETKTMAGNCSLIAENTVIIDKQNVQTINILKNHGYNVLSFNTKEFQKSGGSVDCLYLKIP